MNHEKDYEWSETHCKFTMWIRSVIIYAKKEYINNIQIKATIYSLDGIKEELLSCEDRYNIDDVDLETGVFDFENKGLEKVFSTLTLQRRKF